MICVANNYMLEELFARRSRHAEHTSLSPSSCGEVGLESRLYVKISEGIHALNHKTNPYVQASGFLDDTDPFR